MSTSPGTPPGDSPLIRGGLYLIADSATLNGNALLGAVTAALVAGVGLVQYRHKGPLTTDALRVAGTLSALCKQHDALFFVNDRVDVALLCDAHGVHLGQDDLPIHAARELLPVGSLIGISTHNVDEAVAAQAAGADYIGFGNLFGTTSKADAGAARGVDALSAVCAAVDIPVYAIGGVNGDNLHQVAAAGAAGGALIGAILKADHPQQAATDLVSIWNATGHSF